MSSQYGLFGKPFPTLISPNSAYCFDFGHNHMSTPTNERWDNSHRSHRSGHTLSSSPSQSWEVQSCNATVNATVNASTCGVSTSQNIAKNALRVVVGRHPVYSPSTPAAAPFPTEHNSSFISPSTSQASSPWWDNSLSSPSPVTPKPHTFSSSQFVKKEEPDSPKFIIEPLLPSSLVTKRSSSSSPEPCGSPTQAELETQLLLSQALAPPTEVPLRATQACDDMRQMMRSFRLNPFSIFTNNGKDSNSGTNACSELDPVMTWCGEIAKPLDEEPLIFEWQLDNYRSGLEEELPQLIVMDDVEGSFGITGVEDSDILEATPREDQEPPMIFSPSLLSSEVASRSGFSTSAETKSQHAHVGRLSTPPRSFAPQHSLKEVQRAGSHDSGYESNTSVLTSSQSTYDSHSLANSFHSRSLDTSTQDLSTGFQMYKKPNFSMHSVSRSSDSTSYNHEQTFHLGSLNDNAMLNTDGKLGPKGSLNISCHTKAHFMPLMKSSQHGLTQRHASSRSMYIPTLLNAESNSSPLPYSTSYPFPRSPMDTPSDTRKISSSTSAHDLTTASFTLRSFHQTPSSQDVMNVGRIWESVVDPQPHPDPEIVLRRFNPQQPQQQYHTEFAPMLDAAIRPRMATGTMPRMLSPMPASLPPLCYFGQQQQQQLGRTQPLLSPLTDIAHARLRTLSSGNGPGEAANMYAIARGTEAFSASGEY